MGRVYICSPFRGKDEKERLRNVLYAKECMLDSLNRGESPFVCHLLYPVVLDDSIEDERNKGIEAGMEWLKRSDCLVMYEDYGISEGMKKEIGQAELLGILIINRKIL